MPEDRTSTQGPLPATAAGNVSPPKRQPAEPEQRNSEPSRLHAEIERRFGLLPNFFRLAPENPEITAKLWGFARFGYLDNPLPSLFKERLFVYLSRFCDVRYCIARHVGFLAGLGRPSGDAGSPVQTVDEIIRLIRRPFPRAEQVEPYLSLCAACDASLSELPQPDSAMEESLFACATHVFLQTGEAPRCLAALRHVLGESLLQHLMVFLAFVRTAHYWTKVHAELTIEEDLKHLLATQQTLAECLLNDPEAGFCEVSQKLMDELAALRKSEERHNESSRAHEALRESEERLRRTNTDLNERIAELQKANAEVQRSRAAALNLMEDAVQSRQVAEAFNAALRESEERFRTLFASAPMAVFVCDLDAVIQQYNQRAVELWGREPERGIERHCGSVKLWLSDGTLLPHAQSPIMEVLRTGVPARNVEVFIERPDGSRLPVLVNFSALKNTQGEITGAITSFMDITERKRAEEALRASEERFRSLVSVITDVPWVTDATGAFMQPQPAWEAYTGQTWEEYRGFGWANAVHPDDRERVNATWRRAW
jgi:PAS domain S-box-containing protein